MKASFITTFMLAALTASAQSELPSAPKEHIQPFPRLSQEKVILPAAGIMAFGGTLAGLTMMNSPKGEQTALGITAFSFGMAALSAGIVIGDHNKRKKAHRAALLSETR